MKCGIKIDPFMVSGYDIRHPKCGKKSILWSKIHELSFQHKISRLCITVQDTNSRNYLYHQHPDLWWIENNTSFRGMYMGGYQEWHYGNESFVAAHVKDHGALGKLFWEKKKDIKMGDTPSVLYFLHGDINNPEAESWGGSFVKNAHGPNFWTDNPADSLLQNNRAGAKTVNKFRKAYLDDWSKRMQWLKD